jgi:hypothetical protein
MTIIPIGCGGDWSPASGEGRVSISAAEHEGRAKAVRPFTALFVTLGLTLLVASVVVMISRRLRLPCGIGLVAAGALLRRRRRALTGWERCEWAAPEHGNATSPPRGILNEPPLSERMP